MDKRTERQGVPPRAKGTSGSTMVVRVLRCGDGGWKSPEHLGRGCWPSLVKNK